MIDPTELLRSSARWVLRAAEARSLSVYLPASTSGDAPALLVHVGRDSGARELEDIEAARALARSGIPGRDRDDRHAQIAEGRGGFPGTWLARISLDVPGTSGEDRPDGGTAPRRRRTDGGEGVGGRAVWVGLTFLAGDGADHRLRVPPGGRSDEKRFWWEGMLRWLAGVAEHCQSVAAVLRDPLTGLAGRAEFQARLGRAIERSRGSGHPLSLLFANPDRFEAVNERFGRDAGDGVMAEIGARLREVLRSTDGVFRYGGAVFAILLPDEDLPSARAVGEKIRRHLTEAAYLDGALRLGFSVGVTAEDRPAGQRPGDEDAACELVRRADQALNAAKRAGGGRTAAWADGSEAVESGNRDRLSGIFTGSMSRDYRNMVMLWDGLGVMASRAGFDGLLTEIAAKLQSIFRPGRLLVAGPLESGAYPVLRLHPTPTGRDAKGAEGTETIDPAAPAGLLLARADRQREAVTGLVAGAEGGARIRACAVPLVIPDRADGVEGTEASDRSLGCVYIEMREDGPAFDAPDRVFLTALGRQFAIALDRARLAEEDSARERQESRRLREELGRLRGGGGGAGLEYRSTEMEALVDSIRRVAPTDATVLVTGESGTGKEMIARTLHALSPRAHRPLVVVDCGAIATSLIDSELFGHERGAYTGAGERRIGRLEEADGSSVLLDEIGEMPLEVQSKLLRFVQERQITPVGGTRSRAVDVRVIAATNRDLGKAVAAGRFREDLYYRLNVVRLEVPALRERPDDVLHLANLYLVEYASRYGRPVRRLKPEAQARLVDHDWPGNVRELQNRMMQAVILCERTELGPAELGLPAARAGTEARADRSRPRPPAGEPADDGPPPSLESLREVLRAALASQIDAAIGGGKDVAFPLGRWLSEDLVLAADAAAGGVARRGATLLGIPETTYRRRLRKAGASARAGLSVRSEGWEAVRGVLGELARSPGLDGEDQLDRAQQILLEEVVSRLPEDVVRGAALMGVSEPTFLRRLDSVSMPV